MPHPYNISITTSNIQLHLNFFDLALLKVSLKKVHDAQGIAQPVMVIAKHIYPSNSMSYDGISLRIVTHK